MNHPTMMDLREAARAIGGRAHGESTRFSGVTTDSRRVNAGDLFVALRGDRFDGNSYAGEAVARGAAAAITSRLVPGPVTLPQIVVDDTRVALGKLSAYWRSRFALPLVALTGSNGKTTVKEMLRSILVAHCGERSMVLATEGNLNNDIGMPLTLLQLREAHRYAVIEMGMNHEGEIDYLTQLAQPNVALVNNAQRAHVGILGSIDAIARAKAEIFKGLRPSGVAVLNEDDPFAGYWKKLNTGRRIVTFGFSPEANVRATIEGSQVRFVTPADAFAVMLQVSGEHNVRNALAACAAAHALEIPPQAMQDGLNHFAGVPGRLQRRAGRSGSTVIDDTYNANPESMEAAIRVLAAQPGRRVLVMGDMGELGEESGNLHAQIGAFARESGIDALLALGDASRRSAQAFGSAARHFEAIEALLEEAGHEAARGATLLVKGSRFMQMERVADALAQEGGSDAA
ncbi:MAG: UDP-N-acetylmuramoyl-tripeptide--D-alanyl-D-alanine ligase [Usitatibacter sp.]